MGTSPTSSLCGRVRLWKLGLTGPIPTQTLQRDRHAHYLAVLALIATSEKFATEIRGLRKQKPGVEEFFAPGQTGSSAMPHKRGPIGSENITGLSRVLRGYGNGLRERRPLA